MKPLIEKYASLRLLSFSQGPTRNADQQHQIPGVSEQAINENYSSQQ